LHQSVYLQVRAWLWHCRAVARRRLAAERAERVLRHLLLLPSGRPQLQQQSGRLAADQLPHTAVQRAVALPRLPALLRAAGHVRRVRHHVRGQSGQPDTGAAENSGSDPGGAGNARAQGWQGKVVGSRCQSFASALPVDQIIICSHPAPVVAVRLSATVAVTLFLYTFHRWEDVVRSLLVRCLTALCQVFAPLVISYTVLSNVSRSMVPKNKT
uniref:Uncharacterized protein n=1 Tax=Anopheles coluzzii TaxID=1518534 RepID=A0A8W7PTZ6_ANOCL